MDGRTERREGWRREGRDREPWEPWDPWARSGPSWLPLAQSHLLETLHVLEVEADVEEAQVGIDKLELGAGGREGGR